MFRARAAIRVLDGFATAWRIAVNKRPLVISIFDYGAGNLHSVENALHAIGAQHQIIREASELRRADRLILPGVGHFGQMMHAIDRLEVRETLVSRIREGVPFLGICLGLQALFVQSDEAPDAPGLGIFDGTVRRFDGNMRVPHMGWNNIRPLRGSKLLHGTGEEPYVYFANSYYAPLAAETSAVCEYGCEFAAIIESANVHAVQFHPEKSGPAGLQILKNFACL
jgi:imidazole glycerol phosphate synthase glutamine amidotransferase subunit